MKIGIIGSRRRDTVRDFKSVERSFMKVYHDGYEIVSGGCPKGGDRFAEMLAKKYQVPITIYYARWDELGKRAGYARNGIIAAKSDCLIACVAPDRLGGTEDTIKKFLSTGKTYLRIVK